MTSFLGTGEAYSYSKQGTGGDLQVRSYHELREAGVKSGFGLGRLAHVCHHRTKITISFLRKKAGMIWREGLGFVNQRLCGLDSRV